MKRLFKIALLQLLILSISFAVQGAPQRLSLDGEWNFREASQTQYYSATVPGCNHTDLLNNNLIQDPFYGINEKSLQWVGEKDWEYSRTFEVNSAMLNSENLNLVMEGLDTYADVYINDYKVLSADNMFRRWEINPRNYLVEGENKIRIYFHSVFQVDIPKYLAAPYKLQAWINNDQADIWLSLYARKAGYNYGWDWGPRLITSGVWRPIYLEYWDDVKLVDAFITTQSISKKSASLSAECEVESTKDQNASVSISADGKLLKQLNINLVKGVNKFDVPLLVKSPKLWWSNGLGEPYLYDFEVSVTTDKTAHKRNYSTGIRTIEVVTEKDEWGQSLYVKLNGNNVFMKGANYIPLDNFPNRVKEHDYHSIVKAAADVNMNMLRVWGGGIYEDDAFYAACDKYGILVWQDMMFACGMFPANEQYLQSVASEVSDNVKRLRHHPSIALWNGNNENEISYYGWGWRDKYTPEQQRIYEADLQKLFYETIPQAISTQDKSRYYHPTSPTTGYNGRDYKQGDVHFWSVWKGGWIEEYTRDENIGRFMSEYGYQSYPDMHTISKFAKKRDMNISSEVMLQHQRAKNDNTRDPHFGNNMMKMYMDRYIHTPEKFDEFIYASQFMQAEAVKVAIEAHRRAMPMCQGTLYWQINDCWPAASWSSVDYYGRWKALHYYARDAFNEVLISPYIADEAVEVKVVSDRLQSFDAQIKIEVLNIAGGTINSYTFDTEIAPNISSKVFTKKLSELAGDAKSNEFYVVTQIYCKNQLLSSNILYAEDFNKYDFACIDPVMEFKKVDDGYNISLNSEQLILGLYLYSQDENVVFSHNYLTLLPKKEQVINAKTTLSLDEFKATLKSYSINTLSKRN